MAKEKFDYFSVFEGIGKLAVEEVDVVIGAINGFSDSEALRAAMVAAHEIEHKGDELNHSIYKNIAVDFVTPIDREDLINLSQRLDTVIDNAEDILQCFYMYDVSSMNKDVLPFLELLKKAAESLLAALSNFRNFKKFGDYNKYIIAVNTYEEEADKLYLEAIRKLYTQECDKPLYVVVWTRIFEALESCADACEHVADTMNTIILKNA
ncbi:MAG: DUF47 family protein [Eggerthellaceae bacterium]|nr:DUF47 family protein [Eggerthellaceae bacterium]